MFKRMTTNLNTLPRHSRDWRVLKNAWLLPDGCLNNTGNKIHFRIKWQCVNQGFNVTPLEEVQWCEVRWPGRPSHWPTPSNPAIVVSGDEMLIPKGNSFPLSLRQHQPSCSNLTFFSAHMTISAASLLAAYQGQWPYVWTFALNWYEIQLFFQNTSVILLDFQP